MLPFRIVTLVVGLASLSVAVCGAFSGAANAPRLHRPGVAEQHVFPSAWRLPQQARPHRQGAATTCSTDYGSTNTIDFFVGVANATNVAGGQDSAVLGGVNNESCDSEDGIGAGVNNVIGNSGSAYNLSLPAGVAMRSRGLFR